jgi:hypothetical protein
MRRLLMASALAAGFMAGADGFGERAIAADDKGIWEASFDVTCVEFLQRSKDEAAARARVNNPERGVIYDRLSAGLTSHETESRTQCPAMATSPDVFVMKAQP